MKFKLLSGILMIVSAVIFIFIKVSNTSDSVKAGKQNLSNDRVSEKLDQLSGDHLFRGTKRDNNTVANSNVAASFADLKTPAERYNNLTERLMDLRGNIEQSKSPDLIIKNLLRDIATLRGTEKMAFETSVVNQLAKWEKTEKQKFLWLATYYPAIQKELLNSDSTELSQKDNLFSVIFAKAYNEGFDPYQEAMKIQDQEIRQEFIKEILPHTIVGTLDPHTNLVESLPAEQRREVEQTLLKLSTIEKVYRVPSLKLYLNGGGEEGSHVSQMQKLFSDTAWFWKKSQDIGEAVAKAPHGERRDTVIENMVIIIDRQDPEAAKQWLNEIDDVDKRQQILSKLEK